MRKTYGRYCSQYFKMPALDRSDLQAIEKIIQTQIKPQGFGIAFDGAEYEAVDQIPDQSEPKHALVIYTRAPDVRLKLSHAWAELYSEDFGRSDEAIQQIDQVISKKERKTLWRFLRFAPRVAPIAAIAPLALTMQLIYLQVVPFSTFYAALALMVLIFAWGAMGYRYNLRQFSSINLLPTEVQ